jgi:hypothetical protein
MIHNEYLNLEVLSKALYYTLDKFLEFLNGYDIIKA